MVLSCMWSNGGRRSSSKIGASWGKILVKASMRPDSMRSDTSPLSMARLLVLPLTAVHLWAIAAMRLLEAPGIAYPVVHV